MRSLHPVSVVVVLALVAIAFVIVASRGPQPATITRFYDNGTSKVYQCADTGMGEDSDELICYTHDGRALEFEEDEDNYSVVYLPTS